MTQRQITRAKPDWASTEYNVCPFNCDGTRLILVHRDHFELYDGGGNHLSSLPLGASSRPRWSLTNPLILYYLLGNTISFLNVSTGLSGTVTVFAEYDSIDGLQEGDISADGDHFALYGVKGESREIFLYSLTDGVIWRLQPEDSFNNLYITSRNDVIVSYDNLGVVMYRDPGNKSQLARKKGHMDTCVGLDGRDYLVYCNSDEAPVNPEGCTNGIVRIDISTRERKCLLSLPWSIAVHISGTNLGWVLVECYGGTDGPYAGKVLKVWLDSTIENPHIEPLFEHHSTAKDYNKQPKAVADQAGTRVVYTSDNGDPTPDYCEVWMAELEPVIITTSALVSKGRYSGAMVYQDYRGGGKCSVIIFEDGQAVINENID